MGQTWEQLESDFLGIEKWFLSESCLQIWLLQFELPVIVELDSVWKVVSEAQRIFFYGILNNFAGETFDFICNAWETSISVRRGFIAMQVVFQFASAFYWIFEITDEYFYVAKQWNISIW